MANVVRLGLALTTVPVIVLTASTGKTTSMVVIWATAMAADTRRTRIEGLMVRTQLLPTRMASLAMNQVDIEDAVMNYMLSYPIQTLEIQSATLMAADTPVRHTSQTTCKPRANRVEQI